MLVTIGPDNNTGFRKHLEDLSKVLSKYPSKFVSVRERGHSKTLKAIKKLKPSLVIIGGRNWIIRNKKILDKISCKKGILYCSPFAQAEISGEEIKNLTIYLELLDKSKIDYLFTGSEMISHVLNRKDVIWLPAPCISDLKNYPKKNFPITNNVGILSDKAVHKNTINALAGISFASKVDKIIINGLSEEYSSLVDYFGLKSSLKNVGILTKKELTKILLEIKLLIHVSFSEGFSYSAFEACCVGTPLLVTSAIPWIINKNLRVNDPQDIMEISKKIDYIMNLNKKSYLLLSQEVRRDAERIAVLNNSTCKKNLSNILFSS